MHSRVTYLKHNLNSSCSNLPRRPMNHVYYFESFNKLGPNVFEYDCKQDVRIFHQSSITTTHISG